MPTSTITATYAQNSFGEVIRRVSKDGEHLIVEKDGVPVVVIMSVQEYERMQPRFAQAVRAAAREASQLELTEEQLAQQVREVREVVYQEHYGG